MVAVTAELIKQLRARTNGGLADCKRVLIEAHGDVELAVEYLRRDARAREVAIAANWEKLDAATRTTASLESVVSERVRSGCYERGEIRDMVRHYLALDDMRAIEVAIDEAIATKRAEVDAWPDETDCDRLDRGFAALAGCKIVALQNAGFTASDGHECVEEEARTVKSIGYCFYTFQDLVAAIHGRGLLLAFGSFDDDRANTLSVGRIVQRELGATGLQTVWSGSAQERVSLPAIVWRRRGPELGARLRSDAGLRATYFSR